MTIVLTTPKGRAIFPHLTEADTMFHPEGLFHVKLECPKAESEKIISVIRNGIAQEIKKQHDANPDKVVKEANKPYEIIDEKVVFNFKLKASGIRKALLKLSIKSFIKPLKKISIVVVN